jgi:hypothetical protein
MVPGRPKLKRRVQVGVSRGKGKGDRKGNSRSKSRSKSEYRDSSLRSRITAKDTQLQLQRRGHYKKRSRFREGMTEKNGNATTEPLHEG